MKKGGGNSERSEDKGGGCDQEQEDEKNMQRLGRGGLSLNSPMLRLGMTTTILPSSVCISFSLSFITTTYVKFFTVFAFSCEVYQKQREFYRNAKYLQKFKRSIKQQQQLDIPSTSERPSGGENGAREGDNDLNKNKRNKKNAQSLQELYQKKREEEEKARMEREAMIQAKKEEQQKAEARRRALKEKMLKKTKSGQPVMKYRIEHILEQFKVQKVSVLTPFGLYV
ncbi:UNVERIFIED_CONTAM: hypothetical protein Scaly_0315700 [Sesamum calycinum]|uniref:rRNA-processing protein FYV7 n=1 Tax=Sesamum calycinum TaxID=2727403 RepID=A0AAW2SAR9_9LAMI